MAFRQPYRQNDRLSRKTHMTRQILFLLSIAFLTNCTSPNLENLEDLHNDWKLTGTSGGFTGAGFDASFDNMTINQNLNFVLYEGNVKVAEGKIKEKTSDTEDILLNFSGTKEDQNIWVALVDDGEKYLRFIDNNKMELNSPCCDRYNLSFEKN